MRTLAHEAMMIRYGCLILSVAALAATGCRADPAMELMERELRWQEDEIYYLEDLVDDLKTKLHAYEHATFGAPSARSADDEDDDYYDPTPRFPRSGERMTPPDTDIGDPVEEMPRNLEQAPPFEGLPQYDPLPTSPAEGIYEYEPASAPYDAVEMPAPVEVSQFYDPAEVEEITLNTLLTGLRDFDGADGYDGVALLLEPRNADGEIIDAAGAVSVVVLDPAVPGAGARVARWDLTEEEAQSHFRTSSIGRGLHLELTWPDAVPDHDDLQMFVRFTSAEGREFETDYRLGEAPDAVLPPSGWQAARRQRRRVAQRPADAMSRRTASRTEREPLPQQAPPDDGPLADDGAMVDLPAADEMPTERMRQQSARPRDEGPERGPHPPVWTPYR